MLLLVRKLKLPISLLEDGAVNVFSFKGLSSCRGFS